MTLRDYQTKALDESRAAYRAGKRKVLIHMATGGGKTATFCEVLKSAYAKGTPALVAVRGRKLIQQASDRLTREGVPHGIIMAGAERDQHSLIRVCSIDTLYARRFAPDAKLVVIDEAHQTNGASYDWFLKEYEHALLLAVTATPHLRRGMRHVADVVVYPITARELTERGFLVPLRYFAPETPDLTDVDMVGEDYNLKQLGEAMKKYAIHGNIVSTYLERLAGKPALYFSVNIEHSLLLVDQFLAQGVRAEHVDANCTDDERKAAIARLASGETQVISNVGIMTTGVDITFLAGIGMARPTKSYNLWIQMIGRGTRPHAGKENCIILDHAGNTTRHGFLENERECKLDGVKKSDEKAPAPMKTCMQCYAINPTAAAVCKECGAPFPPQERALTNEDGKLVELTIEPWEARLNALIDVAKRRNYKKGWISRIIVEEFGEEIGESAWKKLRPMRNWFDAEKREAAIAQRPIAHW